MVLGNNDYYRTLSFVGWNPASFEEIASCLMKKGVNQMYHLIVHEDDISLLFSIPNLNYTVVCNIVI